MSIASFTRFSIQRPLVGSRTIVSVSLPLALLLLWFVVSPMRVGVIGIVGYVRILAVFIIWGMVAYPNEATRAEMRFVWAVAGI